MAEGRDVSDATEEIQEAQRSAYEECSLGEAIPIDATPVPEVMLEASIAALGSIRAWQ